MFLHKHILDSHTLPECLLKHPAGPADAGQVLRITLRMLPEGGENALLARIEETGDDGPSARQPMDARMFARTFGPPGDAHAAVAAFCRENGFLLDRSVLGGLFMTITGQAAALAGTFGVELGMFHYEDHVFRGYRGTLAIPAMLAPYAVYVLGLDEASSLLPPEVDGEHGYCSDAWVDALLAALDQPELPGQIMAVSPGLPETLWVPATMQVVDMLIGIAGVLGITVHVAPGDYVAQG
jgi:hypothetical protein